MATTKIKQIEAKDNGSNYNFEEKMQMGDVSRSLFDESHTNVFSIMKPGTLYPTLLMPTVPKDSFDFNLKSLFRAMPSVVPLSARQHMYTYVFYSRNGDLWNKWDTFAKKGYSGNVDLTIPRQNDTNICEVNGTTITHNGQELKPNSMGEMLGLPMSYKKNVDAQTGVITYTNERKDRDFNNEVHILPEMMLLRIWRDYFTNKDYWINNRVILPDDDNDFRLDNNGNLISANNENVNFFFDIGSNNDGITEVYSGTTLTDMVFGLPIHEFPKDRFTSAKPFLQRGDAPTLNMTIQSTNFIPLTLEGHEQVQIGSVGSGSTITAGGTYTNTSGYTMKNTGTSTIPVYANRMGINANTMGLNIGITLNDIRELAIEQSELEKMAMTDGSYAEFGLTFFGIASKNATDHKPVFIGGIHKTINYTEVLQTSESGNSPLGSYAGHATEGDDSYIGHIDCDDFGYIMAVTCIMPDTLYSSGLAKHWSMKKQSEIYLPERAKMGMTAILNKEISYQADPNTDNLPFAYQSPQDDMRYMSNEVHGQIANLGNENTRPYTQSRMFLNGDVPKWSKEFATADSNNVRTDYLASANDGLGICQQLWDIRAVRPLPYTAIPANLL